MERVLLVLLIVFPFAVLFVSAGSLLPGTTATFFLAVAAYGLWLLFQRARSRRNAERDLSHQP